MTSVVQMSAVCTKFAEAVTLVESLKSEFDTSGCSDGTAEYPAARLIQLDSRLLCKWAKYMDALELDDESVFYPGICSFVAAATRVTRIVISCHSPLVAAQLEDVLSQARSVKYLSFTGTCKPCILPQTVTDIRVRMEHSAVVNPSEPDAFVYRASRLPDLQRLSMAYSREAQDITLTSPVRLGRLQSLNLTFSISGSTLLDLSWVARQCNVQLHLNVGLFTSNPALNRAAVDWLSSCRVASLCLRLYRPFPQALQDLWFSLDVQRWLVIPFDGSGAFCCASAPLEALPGCASFELRSSIVRPVVVSWSALTACGANIRFHLAPGVEVHVLGAGDGLPDHVQQPWQLQITGARAVHGAPASQPTSTSYFYRTLLQRWLAGLNACSEPDRSEPAQESGHGAGHFAVMDSARYIRTAVHHVM